MPESYWILTKAEKKDGVTMSNKAAGCAKAKDIQYWDHEDKKHRLKVVSKGHKRFSLQCVNDCGLSINFRLVTNKEEIRYVKRVEKLSEDDAAEVWLLKRNSHCHHNSACGTGDMTKWSQRAPKAKQVAGSKRAHSGDDCLEFTKRQTRTQQEQARRMKCEV